MNMFTRCDIAAHVVSTILLVLESSQNHSLLKTRLKKIAVKTKSCLQDDEVRVCVCTSDSRPGCPASAMSAYEYPVLAPT